MVKMFQKKILYTSLCAIGSLLAFPIFAREEKLDAQYFKHNIQLQLADSNGFPVPDTQFWVTLDIFRKDKEVTIQFPIINFQTGQSAGESTPPVTGGYLITSDGLLPEHLRPISSEFTIAASNNGFSPVFSFGQPAITLPSPPLGYSIEISNAGAVTINGLNTVGNIIKSGPQILMPKSITYPSRSLCKEHHQHRRCFKQMLGMQVSDATGFPVAGTQFSVTLDVIKEGPKVTIKIPKIEFVTGGSAGITPTLIQGGYVYTIDGFLCDEIRPVDLIPQSIVTGFDSTTSTSGQQPPHYIVQIDHEGGLTIQYAGAFGNIIPVGPQVLLPTEITYIVKKHHRLKKNVKLSTGPTNTTEFPRTPRVSPCNAGVRDLHVNAASHGVAAWAWNDNANIPDKTNGVLNLKVVVGKQGKDGKLKVRKPCQLTDLQPPFAAAQDTAISINPCDPKNIVVSYAIINYSVTTSPEGISITPYRAVSFDGGKTWCHNGPTNIQPSGPTGLGDYPGVRFDKFGNCWNCTTSIFTDSFTMVNTPFFMVSTNRGITFESPADYTLPMPPSGYFYDYPQYCFGGSGENYGVYFTVDFVNLSTFDINPFVGFIPITGHGQYGPLSFKNLANLSNVNQIADITASSDGRVFYQGSSDSDGILGAYSYISPQNVMFKSPGPLDENNAGPWQYLMMNFSFNYGVNENNRSHVILLSIRLHNRSCMMIVASTLCYYEWTISL